MILSNEQIIDRIIKLLEQAKNVRCIANVYGPEIEEVFSTIDTIYGKAKMTIEIEFEDLYKKTKGLLSNWEKINKEKMKG